MLHLILAVCLAVPAAGLAAPCETAGVVPAPVRCVADGDPFVLDAQSCIVVDAGSQASSAGELLARQLRIATGFPPPVRPADDDQPSRGAIVLTCRGADTALGEEGYELTTARDWGPARHRPKH